MAWRKWVWCRDLATGHHIDVDGARVKDLVKAGAVEVIEGYAANEGPDARPRPAKPFRPAEAPKPDTPAGTEADTPPTADASRRARKPATAEPAEPTSTEGID